MFKFLKKSKRRLELKSKPFDLSVVWLPKGKLGQLDGLYQSDNDTVPVLLVCLYNVEQLAFEIAKCLKNSTNNSSEGNDAPN